MDHHLNTADGSSSGSDYEQSSACPSPLSSHGSVDLAIKTVPAFHLSPMAWDGKEVRTQDYVIHFTEQDVIAINQAIVYFRDTGLNPEEISQENFPLPPDLACRLGTVGWSLYNGLGVAVLRGLNPTSYNYIDTVVVFAGIASYVCSQRATDEFGGITLGHIRDATHDVVPEAAKDVGLAGSKIPTALAFHTDRFAGDILSLFVVNEGLDVGGGDQFLSSFWRMYQELQATSPEVINTLEADDWPWELKDPITHEVSLIPAPALFYAATKPILQFVHATLVGGPKLPRAEHLPSLTAAQQHAFHTLERCAQQFALKLDRQEGDIQFVNNLSIMHARSAYDGHKKSSRHLLRMFLRSPENAWEIDGNYRDKFDEVFNPKRPQEFVIEDTDPWGKVQGPNAHG